MLLLFFATVVLDDDGQRKADEDLLAHKLWADRHHRVNVYEVNNGNNSVIIVHNVKERVLYLSRNA